MPYPALVQKNIIILEIRYDSRGENHSNTYAGLKEIAILRQTSYYQAIKTQKKALDKIVNYSNHGRHSRGN